MLDPYDVYFGDFVLVYIDPSSNMTNVTLNLLIICYALLSTHLPSTIGGPTLTTTWDSTIAVNTSTLPNETNQSVPKITARVKQSGSQTREDARPIIDRVATMRNSKPIDSGTSIRRTNDSIVITEIKPRQTMASTAMTSHHRVSNLLPRVDTALERSLFRESAPDYPEDEISVALHRLPEAIRELFNMQNSPLDPAINLTERMASYPDHYIADEGREENVCRTVLRNIYPREAHRDNSLVYIPNNHDFMQVIQSELCVNPDGECSYLQDSLPYGMTSTCHQKYAFKKMLYYDPLEKRMASDVFRYPSCCVCLVKTLPFDLRSSAKSTTTSTTSTPTAKPATTSATKPTDPIVFASDVAETTVLSSS